MVPKGTKLLTLVVASSEGATEPQPTWAGTTEAGTIKFSAEPRPENLEPVDVWKAVEGGFKVKVRKGVRKISVLRFLLGKLRWEGTLSMEDYLVLFELYYLVREERDPHFLAKYEKSLSDLTELLGEMVDFRTFPVRVRWNEEDLEVNPLQLIPTASSYFGMRGQRVIRESYCIQLNRRLLPQRLPPKRFIGVGYRDKGTLKNLAYDGSPHWKEVARYNSERERLEEERQAEDLRFRSCHPSENHDRGGG